MNKLRSQPPSVDDFIAGAEQQPAGGKKPSRTPTQTKQEQTMRGGQSRGSTPLPWENPQVRDDVLKVYNLRLPEPYLLKLKHIAAHTPSSMHQFCIDVLLPEIDKKIRELTP